tara:strand:+ start:563 stop:1138 length:576 start_codon:yes stop_codon:yes gene_type:complete
MGGFKPSNTAVPDLDVDDGTISVDADNNRVGIGTTSPSVTLDVIGVISSALDDDSLSQGVIQVGVDSGGDPGGELMFHTDDYVGIRCANSGQPPFVVDPSGNVGIGTTTFDGSAAGVLTIANGTSPAALTADQIYIGSKNSAGSGTDTKATLELFTEEAVDATALDAVGTLTTRLPIWINGTCYWLYLDPV